jgi:hypothetical protein
MTYNLALLCLCQRFHHSAFGDDAWMTHNEGLSRNSSHGWIIVSLESERAYMPDGILGVFEDKHDTTSGPSFVKRKNLLLCA